MAMAASSQDTPTTQNITRCDNPMAIICHMPWKRPVKTPPPHTPATQSVTRCDSPMGSRCHVHAKFCPSYVQSHDLSVYVRTYKDKLGDCIHQPVCQGHLSHRRLSAGASAKAITDSIFFPKDPLATARIMNCTALMHGSCRCPRQLITDTAVLLRLCIGRADMIWRASKLFHFCFDGVHRYGSVH